MSIKPILFNSEMVKAILSGNKTVTRRLIKFPKNKYTGEVPKQENVKVYGNTIHAEEISFSEEPYYSFTVKPPHKIGDILYVRETWQCLNPYSDREYIYKASCDNDYAKDIGKWLPSIHMPKEVARIFLKVADLRVERLQNITEKEIIREGLSPYDDRCQDYNWKPSFYDPDSGGDPQLKQGFEILWDETVKEDCKKFKSNPWVWVIDFERCDKPQEYSL